MRILLLNQYYPPDTAATAVMAARVARALSQAHDVTVLAGRPSYNPTERHPVYWRRRQRDGNVVVERVGSTGFRRGRMAGRVTNYFSYLMLAAPRALFIQTDLIVAMTDPPVLGIAAAAAARIRGRRFIYNIRDLYPDMAVASRLLRPSAVARVWERLHRWALAQADAIIVLGDGMRERVIAKGIAPGRVSVVRDGAAIPEGMPSGDHPQIREIRQGFKFVVLHAGNLGFYGAWESIIEAARMLAGAPHDVGFIFVGDGAARSQLETLANGSAPVRFLPYRPAEDVPLVLAAGDLHLVTVRNGLEGVVEPSKLYPILAAGRPVLAVAADESDVARIVREAGCGFVADPTRPDSVAAAVREAMASPDRLALMGARARAAAGQFEQQGELRKFVRIVESVGAPV